MYMGFRQKWRRVFVALLGGLLAGCGGGNSVPLTIGGVVSGLASGESLVLQNNGQEQLTVADNGTYTFRDRIPAGGSYSVTVKGQPRGQTCVVSEQKHAGSSVRANVTDADVACTTNSYSIGGSVTGLVSGRQVVLSDNAEDVVTVSGDGAFTFPSRVLYGKSYNVTVQAQPEGQTCSIASGSGAGSGVTDNVSSVRVTCSVNTFTISGSVSGLLPGRQVTFQNNGADNLTVAADGPITFGVPVAYGASYAVTVATQPLGQTCTPSANSATGTDVKADITSVSFVCTVDSYSVGGTVSGLNAGAQVTLANGAGGFVNVTSDGRFDFPAKLAFGGSYNVTVATQPIGQVCYVTQGSGSISGTVANVAVACKSPTLSTVATGLNSPSGVAVDSGGNVYVTNTYGNSVLKLAAGTWASSTVPISLNTPTGIAVDTSGNVFVVDSFNNAIKEVPAGAQPVTVVTGLNVAYGIAADSLGHIFVSDSSANRILKIDVNSKAVSVVAVGFNNPGGLAVDSTGNLYVADTGSGAVKKVDANTGVVSTLASAFASPAAVAVDATGNVYVADTLNSSIKKIASQSLVVTTVATGFSLPRGIAVDGAGNIFVADSNNGSVRRIVPA